MRSTVFEPGPGRLDPSVLRDSNLRTVLTSIATKPGATAADVSRSTGLSPSSVFRLLGELEEKGLLVEGGLVRGRRGQPGQTLFMNPEGAYSLGCKLEAGRCELLLRSLGGRVIQQMSVAIPDIGSSGLEQVGDVIAGVLTQQPASVRDRFAGIGVAVSPGYACLSSADWSVQQARDHLQRRTGQPVLILPWGAAGAWAELAAIPPPRPADFLYLYLDRQLHSGFVLDGRLWQGPNDQSGSLARAISGPGEAEAGGGGSDMLDPSQLGAAIRMICLSLGIPLVLIDGDRLDSTLDELARQLSMSVAADDRMSPVIARGHAGPTAILKGAALRPLYLKLFANTGD